MMLSSRNRSPFTETQMQELEHQALIFKYMISGIPIPPDLLYTVKRSLDSSLSSSPHLFSPHARGWGHYQVGFGRKEDPEPGRCRRTDGKKWRCSKEAYIDSKYCERHMQRGKNRSRKHVESVATPNITTAAATATTAVATATSPYHNTSSPVYPFSYSQSSSSFRTSEAALSSQISTTPDMFLDSGSYSQPEKNYRYFNGMRESLDERAFFPESSGSLKSLPESYSSQKDLPCFVLGSDFKSSNSMKTERVHYSDDETQQVHHFFSDLEDDPSTHSSFSTTQLSMSSHYNPFTQNSRFNTGG